jgi:allophanate hydrolase subunit 1
MGLLGQRGSFDPFAGPFGWQLIGKLAKNVHTPQRRRIKQGKEKN